MSKKPNLFLVGAPKCGTTALWQYLKGHPDIYMSSYKEPHFFASDFRGLLMDEFRNKQKYLSLFSRAKNEKWLGEASVFYLYSEEAAQNIYRFNKNARVIISLRSPIEMMYSLYHHRCFHQAENAPSFQKALRMEEERKRGRQLPKNIWMMPEAYYYREIAKFSSQVRRFLKVFGRDQVYVLIFDDFVKNPGREYQKILDFLGLDRPFSPSLERVNPNKGIRFKVLQRLMTQAPPGTIKLAQKVSFFTRPVFKFIQKLNSYPIKRPPMDKDLEKALKKEFLPEVKKLSKILNRDLTFWCW